MDAVVCAKITVDTAELRADPDTGAPRLDGAPRRIGTIDENALEEAVRLREAHGGSVTLLVLGGEVPEELLLRALAMGADRAVVVRDGTADRADALATATVLAAALRRLAPWDLVLCGEGSLDQYSRQVGPRLGEELGLPVLVQAAAVRLAGGTVTAERVLEDRTEGVEAALPALVTVRQEINQPRLPTVLQILGASRKPRTEWTLEGLGFPPGATAAALSGVETLETAAPPGARRRLRIEGETAGAMADEAARLLFAEGVLS
ncbi:MAG TPA: electron transfer flavoprotein subunit beta/FixA family protein [Thermoanaerobaculia bacterium]